MQHNNLNPGYYNTTSTAVPSMLANQFIGTSRLTGLAVPSKTPADPYLYGPYLMQMPVNPFNNLNTVTIVTDGTTDFSAVANDTSGWLYEKTTGTFKVNYSGTDSNGVAYVDY
jgi:hypothetical protein